MWLTARTVLWSTSKEEAKVAVITTKNGVSQGDEAVTTRDLGADPAKEVAGEWKGSAE